LLPGEGVELLNTGDGGVFDAIVSAVLVQGSPDLSRAEDDTINFLRVVDGSAMFRIGNDPFELRVTGELLNV
jgi:hypothetical protein